MKRIFFIAVLLTSWFVCADLHLDHNISICANGQERKFEQFITLPDTHDEPVIILENKSISGYTNDDGWCVTCRIERQEQDVTFFFEVFDQQGKLVSTQVVKTILGCPATIVVGNLSNADEKDYGIITIETIARRTCCESSL